MTLDRTILESWEKDLLAENERVARQLAHVRGLLADLPAAGESQVPGRRTRGTAAQTSEAGDAVNRLLAAVGQPTNRQIIYEALLAEGIRFGGVDGMNTFSAVLSRDPRFVPVRSQGRGIWGLAVWTDEEPVDEPEEVHPQEPSLNGVSEEGYAIE